MVRKISWSKTHTASIPLLTPSHMPLHTPSHIPLLTPSHIPLLTPATFLGHAIGLRPQQTDTTVLNPIISPKLRVARFYLMFVTALLSPQNSTDTKKRICWSESILHGACPCLPPTTVLRHVVVLRHLPTSFKKCGGQPHTTCHLTTSMVMVHYNIVWCALENF